MRGSRSARPAWPCTMAACSPIEETLATAELALTLEPGLAAAHVARGLALLAQGQLDEAERAYERAIALEPEHYDAHYAYARLCFQRGRKEDAARLFRRAAALRPERHLRAADPDGIENGLGEIEKCAGHGAAVARAGRARAGAPAGKRPRRLRGGGGPGRPWAIAEAPCGFAARALALEPDDHPVQYNVACTYSPPGRARAGARRPGAHDAGRVRPSLGLAGAGRRLRPAARTIRASRPCCAWRPAPTAPLPTRDRTPSRPACYIAPMVLAAGAARLRSTIFPD